MSSVITLDDHRSYHLYRKEADMGKGINQLCGIVTNELGQQVKRGDAFIFINKPRTNLKLLIYEQVDLPFFTDSLKRGF
jgi:transposase